MFGFGKNNKSKIKNKTKEPEPVDPKLSEQIHTMPERFYIKPARKRSGLTWIILLGILVVAILVAVAIYFSINLSRQPKLPAEIEPLANNPTIPTGTPSPAANNNLTSTTTAIEVTNPNSDLPTSTAEVVDGPSQVEAQELAIDQDGDGLTLAEEQLYKTDPQVSDTDLDTYADGAELINGYDPTVRGATLEQTGLFRKYSNTFYAATYPTSWELRDQSPDSAEVLFMSGSGEFAEILILQNLNNLSLDDWYKQQFPQLAQTAPTRVSINGVKGIVHPNGLTYYLLNEANPNSIYIITYNLAGLSTPRYLYTFRSMVNSFRLVE